MSISKKKKKQNLETDSFEFLQIQGFESKDYICNDENQTFDLK